jgi:hypothetical protein
MDLLDWTKLNEKVKVSFTKKKYFNQFYYKLTYCVPGARLMTYKFPDDHELMQRVLTYNARRNSYNYSIFNSSANDYYDRWQRPAADFDQLRAFAGVYNTKDANIKFRIEQDIFNIYSDSETYLYRVANLVLGEYKFRITEFCGPESVEAKVKLDQGFTIVKKEPTHPYRVKLKEGFQHVKERQGLATYLKNLNDDVKITTFMLNRLSGTYKYFSGGHIYVKDRRIIDLLILVSPNIIGTVNQMVINN